jgi:zinc D-Ala-D-Ala carboxypeptidase
MSQHDTDLGMGRTSRLEANFTIQEFAVTRNVEYRAGLLEAAWEHWTDLKLLATMLQHIRDHFCAPVVVHSGIRSEALNEHLRAMGHPASRTSQHMLGQAADFHVHGVGLVEVFDWIRNESGLKWGQLILEGDPPGWIHLSTVGNLERTQQVLTWSRKGGYRRLA